VIVHSGLEQYEFALVGDTIRSTTPIRRTV
jgi:hypothetical protein